MRFLSIKKIPTNAWLPLILIALTHLSAFCIYLFFPTTLAWPQVSPDMPFGWMASLIYSMDQPTNLLPSMHCYVSWMLWLSVCGRPEVPRGCRRFFLFFSVLICLATQTLKQHYLADLIAGIARAEPNAGKDADFFAKILQFFHGKFRKN